MDPHLASVVRNEALLRAVNEEIERVSEDLEDRSWLPDDRRVDFHCECGTHCDARVSMTTEDYVRAHAQNDRFVVAPGHETEAVERVVERQDGYSVVDKVPEADGILRAPLASDRRP